MFRNLSGVEENFPLDFLSVYFKEHTKKTKHEWRVQAREWREKFDEWLVANEYLLRKHHSKLSIDLMPEEISFRVNRIGKNLSKMKSCCRYKGKISECIKA